MVYLYIDENGVMQSTFNRAPVGYHYEFEQKPTYMNIMVVRDCDCEVHSEYQGWTSLRDLCKALGYSVPASEHSVECARGFDMTQKMYYLASMKHTSKKHEHIVFWGKNHCGYTPVIGNYIGAYSFMEAMKISDGIDTIAFPVEVASTLIVPEPRMKNGLKFYDQVGPCIPNDELSWAFIIQSGIYKFGAPKSIKPEYFRGKRRT